MAAFINRSASSLFILYHFAALYLSVTYMNEQYSALMDMT